ncbi:hypothetical protein [Sphingomonas glacialis]|uniref:Uncharacterized protein n=1 Tax=Sphingomonas glacialis TaxID=658225 RepID=A0A502FQI4_9SPHN|nr:hypothetical protein [Sphingomonas glacialis]TPG51671.1 hypothetical protein EAH76_16790 [Sphingomonas glacialis]
MLQTARARGQHHSVVVAHIAQFNTNPDGLVNAGHDMRELISTDATRGPHQGVIETTLIEECALPPEPLERAVMTAAFLVKYYGEGGQHQATDRPLDVVITKARYAVVTVTIDAVTYVIVDIFVRMLKPPELARAGLPRGLRARPDRAEVRARQVGRAAPDHSRANQRDWQQRLPADGAGASAANQPGAEEMRIAA